MLNGVFAWCLVKHMGSAKPLSALMFSSRYLKSNGSSRGILDRFEVVENRVAHGRQNAFFYKGLTMTRSILEDQRKYVPSYPYIR